MKFRRYKMSEIATIAMSNVDKKTNEGETPVKLCNFVDVYRNWAITKDLIPSFMSATAKPQEVERFTLSKGQVALTKDSETRDDIGIATYIADKLCTSILRIMLLVADKDTRYPIMHYSTYPYCCLIWSRKRRWGKFSLILIERSPLIDR